MKLHTLIGEIVGLMHWSQTHSGYTVADIGRVIVPPVLLDQYTLVRHEGKVVGYGSYALLTLEAETGFIAGTRKMVAGDWKAGDRLWLMDVLAPFGHAAVVAQALRTKALADGHSEVRFRRTKPGIGRRYSRVAL